MSVINKLGRRKSSVARIYLKSGKGKITINKRDHKEYFKTDVLQYKIFQPFELTGTKGKYDATINVKGGGNTRRMLKHFFMQMILLTKYFNHLS